MKLFGFLRPKTQVVLDHPAFGAILLCRGKNGPYWMHDAYEDDELAISIETRGDSPPSDDQVAFFERIVNDPGQVFARAAHLMAPRYFDYFAAPLPSNWRDAFRLGGLGVPLDGVETNNWDVTFESFANGSGFLFTCYFEQGNPVHVSVDT